MKMNGRNGISRSEFWRAISVLIKNYHAVNKKLSGTKIVHIFNISKGEYELDPSKVPSDLSELENSFIESGIEVSGCPENIFFELISGANEPKQRRFVVVSKFLYKQNSKPANYVVQIVDLEKMQFHSVPLASPEILDPKQTFSVHFVSDEIVLKSSIKSTDEENGSNWLEFVLKPKLIKWSQSAAETHKNSVKSLNQIDIEEYTNLYTTLKKKYGQDMVDRWTESTDPLKFVFEDVAIATYLILLWHKLNDHPKNFVDMGCGNGLLVHILNSEGYNGFGVDIRKRKIWDIYPETTKLKEYTIIPNDYTAFTDVDWMIGNHSDELSAWIPVLAAMSSYNTKYFLLPCCAYEFSGKKFQRRNCEISVYNDFLNYVKEVSDKCRFLTEIDRLKIPSTKRVAIIGSARLYPEEEYDVACQDIEEFVNSEISKTNCFELKLREKDEVVRNCTKIDKSIIDRIVMIIFEFLLKDDSYNVHNGIWRRGRCILLHELASLLSKENLKNIKAECGGLKTLIKNKHDIFEVSGDSVKIRYPRKKEERPKGMQFKKRPCFFYLHHPDGCPLLTNECTYVHERINF